VRVLSPEPAETGPYDRPVRILLVEDERGIADFVERALRGQGHDVEIATDGLDGERRVLDGDQDLVILDVMLPGRSGLEVLERIRRAKPVLPIIMLTARAQVADKVKGLDAGATDYIAKPFSVEELLARVRAHLRTPAQVAATRLGAAGIEMDLLRRVVTRDGEPVRLSGKEFDLLAYFLRHPGSALSREQILGAVWEYDHDPGTNVVDVYVGYLRRKLARPDRPAPIETVRSVGYRLRAA
jgi:two-component system, OmpR family, response regulator